MGLINMALNLDLFKYTTAFWDKASLRARGFGVKAWTKLFKIGLLRL